MSRARAINGAVTSEAIVSEERRPESESLGTRFLGPRNAEKIKERRKDMIK